MKPYGYMLRSFAYFEIFVTYHFSGLLVLHFCSNLSMDRFFGGQIFLAAVGLYYLLTIIR